MKIQMNLRILSVIVMHKKLQEMNRMLNMLTSQKTHHFHIFRVLYFVVDVYLNFVICTHNIYKLTTKLVFLYILTSLKLAYS